MKILSTFIRTFINSISVPSYYNDVLKAKSSFSWKYFIFLNFLLSFVVLGRVVEPMTRFDLTKIIDGAFATYPSELMIMGDEDGLSINQPLPYSVRFPAEMIGLDETPVTPEEKEFLQDLSLVTFDTDAHISGVEDFYKANSIIVVTETTVYNLSDLESGEVRSRPIPKFEHSFVIDSQKVEAVKAKLLENPIIQKKIYIPLIAGFLFCVIFPATLVFRLATVIFFSFLVWLAALIFLGDKKLSLTDIFHICLHSITLTIIVATLLEFIPGTPVLLFGFWYFLVFFIWTFFILFQLEKKPSTVAKTSTAKKITKKRSKK